MAKYNLICMSFDGEFVNEHNIFSDDKRFESIEAAWKMANDMGSRWFFYPFCFVTSESNQTIVDTPQYLEFLKNKRVSTAKKLFKKFNDQLIAQNITELDCDYFICGLRESFQQ